VTDELRKIIDSWVGYLFNERGYSRQTVVKYYGNLRRMFDRLHIRKKEELADIVINRRLVDAFWRDAASGVIRSDATRAGYLSALKSLYAFCHKTGRLDVDYSDKIEMPRRRLLYLEGLTRDEQKRLRHYIPAHLKTEKDMRDAALIMFLWATACRIGEALRLRCHPDGYIYLHDQRVVSGDFQLDGSNVYAHIRGKGKRDRRIIVPHDALAYLNLYLRERAHKNDILFHNVRNTQNNKLALTHSGAGRAIAGVLKKIGARKEKGLNTHVFRHTAINAWIDMGYSDMQIITMTGHTSPEGLRPYHLRNKYLTDVFGGDGLSTGRVTDPALKKLEELIRLRHATPL